ncbi:MAG: SDR family oxidoreductase [Cyanobacteria bacterium P01_H01_bin.105]
MKILLMGATGNSATPAIKALQEKGLRPVAAVRDIPKAKKHLGGDLDFVHFDYMDSSTFAPALDGVNRLFLIAPPGTKDPAIVRNIMQVAKDKGVELILFQSGRTSSSVEGKPLNQIEKDIDNNDLNCCIVRPAWFMQNFHTWTGTTLEDNEICLPAGDGKVAWVDVNDLGAAIATILSSDGHGGKRYDLTGSEALDHNQVASIFSEVTGRSIPYKDLSDDAYVQKMIEKGWAEKSAKYVVWLCKRVQNGSEEKLSDDLPNLLGRPPKSFREFVKDEFIR